MQNRLEQCTKLLNRHTKHYTAFKPANWTAKKHPKCGIYGIFQIEIFKKFLGALPAPYPLGLRATFSASILMPLQLQCHTNVKCTTVHHAVTTDNECHSKWSKCCLVIRSTSRILCTHLQQCIWQLDQCDSKNLSITFIEIIIEWWHNTLEWWFASSQLQHCWLVLLHDDVQTFCRTG